MEGKLQPSKGSVPDLLVRLWGHLRARRKKQFFLLLILMLVSGVAEAVSLGAVVPFLGALTAPERVLAHPVGGDILARFGIHEADSLVLPLTLAFIAAAAVAGGIRLLLLWASTRLSYGAGADLSIEVYRRTLYQPYRVHVARNSSEVISAIISKVGGVVGVLTHTLSFCSSLVLTSFVVLALIAIDPVAAMGAGVLFGLSYAVVAWIARVRLELYGQRVAAKQTEVIKSLQEGLGGIRDVLLDGAQPIYCETYRNADIPLRMAQSHTVFLAQGPRYFMEVMGIVLIAGLAYVLSGVPDGFTAALPVLGALALGAQRLLPALQQAYLSWATIAGSRAAVADVMDLLDQPLPAETTSPPPAPIPFGSRIEFEDVGFRYADDGPWVLKDLNLTIEKGARVGMVGETGSGKSTTMDLLMGLLEPSAGQILIDGEPLDARSRRAWQMAIAHVPQAIYLADATIAENIAFGRSREQIDMARVQEAARRAQIADFIESSPRGYDTMVGERGVRLSGGQRQRIGIARALYKKVQVLVFDEATNALDTVTERAVMDSIENLDRELTVVVIAHRLSTVENCDLLIELQNGRVGALGSYTELLARSPTFLRLAERSPLEEERAQRI